MSPQSQLQVIYGFSELLYSPVRLKPYLSLIIHSMTDTTHTTQDAEILSDICVSLVHLLQRRVENVEYALQQGVLTRLRELVGTQTSTFAIRAICAMCYSPNPLHYKVVLSSLNKVSVVLFIQELLTIMMKLRNGFLQTLPLRQSHATTAASATTSTSTSNGTATKTSTSSANSNGNNGSLDLSSFYETCEDLFEVLTHLFVLDSKYYLEARVLDDSLVAMCLFAIDEIKSHNLMITSGRCLLIYLSLGLSNCVTSEQVTSFLLSLSLADILKAMYVLLTVTDNALVALDLQVLYQLYVGYSTYAPDVMTSQQAFVELGDRLSWLSHNPNQAIFQEVEKLQDLLERAEEAEDQDHV